MVFDDVFDRFAFQDAVGTGADGLDGGLFPRFGGKFRTDRGRLQEPQRERMGSAWHRRHEQRGGDRPALFPLTGPRHFQSFGIFRLGRSKKPPSTDP